MAYQTMFTGPLNDEDKYQILRGMAGDVQGPFVQENTQDDNDPTNDWLAVTVTTPAQAQAPAEQSVLPAAALPTQADEPTISVDDDEQTPRSRMPNGLISMPFSMRSPFARTPQRTLSAGGRRLLAGPSMSKKYRALLLAAQQAPAIGGPKKGQTRKNNNVASYAPLVAAGRQADGLQPTTSRQILVHRSQLAAHMGSIVDRPEMSMAETHDLGNTAFSRPSTTRAKEALLSPENAA